MMKDLFKKIFAILAFLLASIPAFSGSIGFTSVRSGFGWWLLAIMIALVSAVIVAIIAFVLSDNADCQDSSAIAMGVMGTAGAVGGFWIFPTIWCGFLGEVLGLIVSLTWFKTYNDEEENALHSLVFTVISLVAIVLTAIYLPQSWWIWKYFSVALLILAFPYIAKFVSNSKPKFKKQSDSEIERNGRIALNIRKQKIDVKYEQLSNRIYNATQKESKASWDFRSAELQRNQDKEDHPFMELFGMNDTTKLSQAEKKHTEAKGKLELAESEMERFMSGLDAETISFIHESKNLSSGVDEAIRKYEELLQRRKEEEEEAKRLQMQQIEESRNLRNQQIEEEQIHNTFSSQITSFGDLVGSIQNSVLKGNSLDFQLWGELEKRLMKIKEQKSLMSKTEREQMKNNREKILEMLKICRDLPKSNAKIIKNLLKELS